MSNQPTPSALCDVDAVLKLYTELAQRPDQDFGWAKGRENARALGYEARWLDSLPDALWESSSAVGNPFSPAPLREGDTVVDLGCGAGADACIAALTVGKKGRVMGVDLTPAMIEKAKRMANTIGLSNVTFEVHDMASVPAPDASVDVVISNGAINLSAHKPCVFREAYRMLKPGGRLQFADMVRTSPATSCERMSWANCVGGTVEPKRYLEMMRDAGFVQAELVAFTSYKTETTTTGAIFRANRQR